MKPLTLREILQAEIASLGELAGQLKGLSEMKLSVANDVECPPEHPERFRQKAMEHNKQAIGALMAKQTLEVVLAARTEAEQIALMQHYVLEFGQEMSRKAKLSDSLADDDPQKQEVDDSGWQASFVATTLNRILSHVAPEPPVYLSPPSTAHPTMAGRLGQVLSWTANLIALAIAATFVVLAGYEPHNASFLIGVGVVIAAVIWMIGRGIRYVLAGS
jgi:hypothetical protein